MSETPEHVDVLIVGAGLSGIGAATHVRRAFGHRSFAVLESRDSLGGTWDLFRYPGVRSDSDMHTLGYRFRPWEAREAIADGPSILDYVRDTATDEGIAAHIRYRHRVVSASFCSESALWTVDVLRDGEPVAITCQFLYLCCGYYDYDTGHAPEFPGSGEFAGQLVHPQHWPAELDYTGKRVVVIGSGATAVTLVPAMAADAEHVTMLQRSPSYILPLPGVDRTALRLRGLLGSRLAYALTRWKNVARITLSYRLFRRFPRFGRAVIRKAVSTALPKGYDIDTHFRPAYDPWDQRLCVVPDGDLFRALRSGRASMVTEQIERFTADGILLRSGEQLPADVIVTATGLKLRPIGGVTFSVDGKDIPLPDTVAYKGLMLSGLPNMVFTIGYTNASWTLKADLVSEFFCRTLRHLDRNGYDTFEPRVTDPGMPTRPLLDFASGYVQRSIHEFPRAGAQAPWQLGMSYLHDVLNLRHRPINDGTLHFGHKTGRRASSSAQR